jgi:type I restriction enzyme S subunit
LEVEGSFFASEHAIVVTPSEQTDIRWLAFILISMNLNQFSESSAQPGLSVAKVLALEVLSPPSKQEQSAIVTILSDMKAELAALEARREKAHAIKQGMMQELLTGRIRLV